MREKFEIVQLQRPIQKLSGVVARSGGSMPVQHARSGNKHRRPALLPSPKAKIQVFDVSRVVDFVQPAELEELLRIEERTSAASVEHVAQVLTWKRQLAPHGEIHRRALGRGRHDGLAGFFAAQSFGEKDLRGRAE